MVACAIEDILAERARCKAKGEPEPQSAIGLYGVDMAANEEYGYQRAGCQHFLLMAADLGIHVEVPPESDLLRPMPIYGFCEGSHWHIKNLTRQRELQARLGHAEHQAAAARESAAFLKGALDDLNYQMLTRGEDRTGMGMDPSIQALFPRAREDVLASQPAPLPAHPAIAMEGELVSLLTGIGQRREDEDTMTTMRRLLSERQQLLEQKPKPKKRKR